MALKTILCVEEEQDLTDVLEMTFCEEGYKVHRIPNAEAALEFCLAMTPDIIVSDIYLRRLDGLSFLKAVRGIGRLHRVPFVAVSVENDPSFVSIAREFGATAYLWRPFDNEELVEVVSRILIPHKKHKTSVSLWPLV